MSAPDFHQLAHDIKLWARELGFDQAGITDTDLRIEEPRLQAWLDAGYHGSMDYMARHGMMRARAHELLPGTVRVLSVRMNYLPFEAGFAATLRDPTLGYISRYALGRDYHKVLRNRLKQLGDRIEARCAELFQGTEETLGEWRPFVDSAPILERPLAAKAGLGWVGKHSLLLNESAGSFFFLGGAVAQPAATARPASGEGAVRQVRRLHQHLPDRRHCRPLCGGWPPLHLLFHHRE